MRSCATRARKNSSARSGAWLGPAWPRDCRSGFRSWSRRRCKPACRTRLWRSLVAGFGYATGFLIVILGRQQLFIETTLTAVIPALTQRNLLTTPLMLRVWTIVLVANWAATWVFAAISAYPGVFSPPTMQAMADLSARTMGGTFWHIALTGGSAGGLIGLMVWLLPGAGPIARTRSSCARWS
jgi:formate/nitrite transporter FocA (FNT family)